MIGKVRFYILFDFATLPSQTALLTIYLRFCLYCAVCISYNDCFMKPLSEWCSFMKFNTSKSSLLMWYVHCLHNYWLSFLLRYFRCSHNTDVSIVGMDAYYRLAWRASTNKGKTFFMFSIWLTITDVCPWIAPFTNNGRIYLKLFLNYCWRDDNSARTTVTQLVEIHGGGVNFTHFFVVCLAKVINLVQPNIK